MKHFKTIRIIAAIVFLISLFCTVDLGLSLLFNTGAVYHDGYASHSLLHAVFGIFGDGVWTFDMFFGKFETSAGITYALLVVNVVLLFCKGEKNKFRFALKNPN